MKTCKENFGGSFFDGSPVAICLIHVELDANSNPCDFSFVYLNDAFAEMVCSDKASLIDRRFYSVFPDANRNCLKMYFDAAYNGKTACFRDFLPEVEKYLLISCFSAEPGYCVCIMQDLSPITLQVRQSLENADILLFYYDTATRNVYMPQCVRDCYNLKYRYDCLEDAFSAVNIAADSVSRLSEVMSAFHNGGECMDAELQLLNGTWIRISISKDRNDRESYIAIGYIENITKRKQSQIERAKQEESLKDALVQAQYASKAKSTFLSNMSHDIRTPMNAIVGFTAIAASHINEKEVVKDSLEKIMTSSRHLLNLINDVLDMSRIESGKMHLQNSPCNLSTIMHDLVDMVQSQILAKQLDFFVDTLNVRNEEIITDSIKLNQILINLIGNAIKFNHPGGVVSVRIQQKEMSAKGYGCYVFTVKDNGSGIAPEFMNHIFEPFERERNSEKNKIEGTGLGLAIVNNIVNMMDGKISVSSEPGKGTEFKVELNFKLQNEKEYEVHYEKLRGLRALVADDDFNTCDSVSTMLQQMGMEAEWTMTGKEAVLKAKKAHTDECDYSAFIIDWLMPDMNGIEVTRRIRSVIGKETPIFILTAYDWTDIEQEAKEAGVTAFCRKPLFMSELRETLLGASGLLNTEIKTEKKKMYDISDFKGKRILVADDHPLNREIAVRLLSDSGFQVEEAEDGKIALEKFKLSRSYYYDLILMDVRMPNMDGYKASDEIRNLHRADAKTIPILAMTANAFDEDKKLALEHGMNAHLSKPLDVKEMFETLGRYLAAK